MCRADEWRGKKRNTFSYKIYIWLSNVNKIINYEKGLACEWHIYEHLLLFLFVPLNDFFIFIIAYCISSKWTLNFVYLNDRLVLLGNKKKKQTRNALSSCSFPFLFLICFANINNFLLSLARSSQLWLRRQTGGNKKLFLCLYTNQIICIFHQFSRSLSWSKRNLISFDK